LLRRRVITTLAPGEISAPAFAPNGGGASIASAGGVLLPFLIAVEGSNFQVGSWQPQLAKARRVASRFGSKSPAGRTTLCSKV